ncbi:MAG: hypothetical protein BTN85_1615 [Candidatus Methanohalarchaeum thermophilum]|uniref:Uncharacterized protein n=1 Tax=Methanohalarchaeum thermophilum TaxID=1903181 RepID=A0A1Q6DXK5_METT1|nr:MAG: hypothetical protein BTN85_1615 [Candidatus Methanohalarchaeum thermophilum]
MDFKFPKLADNLQIAHLGTALTRTERAGMRMEAPSFRSERRSLKSMEPNQ